MLERFGRPGSRTALHERQPRGARGARVQLRGAGLPVGDEQLLTPLRSVQTISSAFGAMRASAVPHRRGTRLPRAQGVRLVDGRNDARIDAVFVAEPTGSTSRSSSALRAPWSRAPAADRQSRSGVCARRWPDLQPGRHADRCAREGDWRAAPRVGNVARGGARARGAARPSLGGDGRDRRRRVVDVALGHLGGSVTVLVEADERRARPGRVPEKRRRHLR